MKGFFQELKRRKVTQVALVYLIAGWLIMQVVDVMFPALDLPEWTISLVAGLLIVGFPIALILSWAYELSPSGIKREADVEAAPAAATTATDLPAVRDGRKAVAVLPFADMSPEGDQAYFSDGLTEELLNVLAQLKELRVASRTSSFAFKGATADIPTVAKSLGVDHVVEGSVRKAGERLRITAQLIDAATDTHIWSQAYDRDLDDVFAIQDDIARQIAESLQVRLLPAATAPQGTGNIEAYEYFFRGRSLFNSQGRSRTAESIEMFRKAAELDPDFSRAWAGLALSQAYLVLFFDGGSGGLTAADEASRKAIELDPDTADGYTARIMVEGARLNLEAADAAFRKAIELEPDNFEAYYQYGRHMIKRGDLEQALAMFARASEIDPYDFRAPILSMGIIRDTDPDKARELALVGIRNAEIFLEQHPDSARAYVLTAGALQYVGQEEKARHFMESAMRIDPDSEDTQYNAACFYARIGEVDKALACMEKGMHDPDWIDNDRDLDPIRDDPRFVAMMAKRRAQGR